ncbi:PREDICTED: keratin-associated protein 15-1-like [Elephantulus edwardii]|uniref:keratin-associated protein 15-1-like n=1 Tax=Elephantulus edwardii TaxID=28737 RepID=UPI0003F071C5|nr:PREDICTED: keratin-associated protein 15-1-like [Elephantulus edwardii]
MSYNYSSGNFSSRSFGGFLGNQVPTYDAFYPGNVSFSSNNFHVGSSVYSPQETFCEPSICQTPCAVERYYQMSCYRPKNHIIYSPCQTNYAGSVGYGNTGFGSFGYGNSGFQSLGCGSNFGRPTYFSSRSHQSTCYQPGFGSRFF